MNLEQSFNPWQQKTASYLWTYLRKNPESYIRTIAPVVRCIEFAQTVADIGCGTGAMLDHLNRYGVGSKTVYIGIDKTEKAVSICRKRYAILPKAQFICADFRTLRDLSVDLVIVKDLIEHLPHLHTSVASALRFSDRFAVLSFFNVWQKSSVVRELNKDYYFSCFNIDDIEALCVAGAFNVKERNLYPELQDAARTGLERINPQLAAYQTGYPAVFILERIG